MTPAEHQQIHELLAAIGTDPAAKAQLKALLAQLRKSWNDLAEIVRPGAPAPSHLAAVSERRRKQIRDRFAHMGADGNEGDNAERMLKTLLGQIKLPWDDIAWLIQPASLKDLLQSAEAPPPLAVLVNLIDRYVAFPVDYASLAVALWAMHTHIFERFSVTPRLLPTSPVRECGKTTLMNVLERLVARAERCDNISAAGIYSAIDEDRSTLLLDEAEHLDVAARGVLAAVLHAGFQRGGSIARMVRGRRKRYNVFAPIALAAIGTKWSSLPLLSRSIIIRMRRHDGSRPLQQLDPENTRDLDAANLYVRDWIERVEIARDPSLPEQLGGRSRDLWRPLIAIADASGSDWGERARAAAVALRDFDFPLQKSGINWIHAHTLQEQPLSAAPLIIKERGAASDEQKIEAVRPVFRGDGASIPFPPLVLIDLHQNRLSAASLLLIICCSCSATCFALWAA